MRIFRRGSLFAFKALLLCLSALSVLIGFHVYNADTTQNDSLMSAVKRFANQQSGDLRMQDNKTDVVVARDNAKEVHSKVTTMPKVVSTSKSPSSDQNIKLPVDQGNDESMQRNKELVRQLYQKWNGFKNVKMPKVFYPSDPPKEMDKSKKQWTEDVYFQEPFFPQKFEYVMNNENLCGKERVDVMIYVHTTPDHHDRRNIIRETWGDTKLFKKMNVRLIFLLGKSTEHEAKLNDALKYEQALYKDIIKGDFIDSYKNLTLKAIMGLKWIRDYCPQARYILKSDDDIFINIFGVMRYLFVDHKNDKRFIGCYAWPHNGMHIFRDPNSCYKWCIEPGQLVGRDTYPRYCAGAGFVMTTDVALDLYNASQRHPFFWVDDAYLTGLLPRVVPDEITYFHFDHLLTMHQPTADKAILESPVVKILVVGGDEKKRAEYWKNSVEKKYKDLKDFGIE